MNTKVIILAAGIGSRLKPLTENKPKCMVNVKGIPILEHQLKGFLSSGIKKENIFIITGYKSEFIECFIKEKYAGVNLFKNEDYLSTNNMYSLSLGIDLLDQNHDLIICNADCVYDPAIIRLLIDSNLPDLVAVEKDAFIEESMKVTIKNGKLVKISKSIEKAQAFGVSIDLYKFSPNTVKKLNSIIKRMIITEKNRNLWTEVAIDEVMKTANIYPLNISGLNWFEIDNYDDLNSAEIIFSKFNIDSKKCIVLDLDGTTYLGNNPINETIKFIKDKSQNKNIYFLTNNTSKIPNDYLNKLNCFGLDVKCDQIITPLESLIEYLKAENIKYVNMIFNNRVKNYLLNIIPNLKVTNDPTICEALIIGYDTELSYGKLSDAAILLANKNIKYIATHSDNVCPTENGFIPDIGSFIALLLQSTGRKPDIVLGKPNRTILGKILNIFDKEEIVVIGDRIYTDKILADNIGSDFILVLTGETKREDVEDIKSYPSLVLRNLGDLN